MNNSKVYQYKIVVIIGIGLFLSSIISFSCSNGNVEINDNVEIIEQQKPNFIFFLVDDHGWYGTPIKMEDHIENSNMPYKKMPNLVSFAKGALRFTDAYSSAPACGPSRASLQTGRTTAANNYVDHKEGFTTNNNHKFELIPGKTEHQLFPGVLTIADVLKSVDANYATANFGKWHVSIDASPQEFGYDFHDGNTVNSGIANTAYPNPKDIVGITDRSIDFIKNNVEQNKPFYLQMSHYAVHGPARFSPDAIELYENLALTKSQKEYGAMAEDMDVSLGRIIQEVKDLGIDDNTYIIYMSDNGLAYISTREPEVRPYLPLRGNKMTLWEGGIRVPLFISGPGIESGICREPVVGYDLLPTLVDLAGGKNKIPANVDGGSWKDLLLNNGLGSVQRANEGLLFHYPVYRDTQGQHPATAFRLGDFKLIHFYETNTNELYNLKDDIAEKNDIAKNMPNKVSEMYDLMQTQLDQAGATYPTKI